VLAAPGPSLLVWEAKVTQDSAATDEHVHEWQPNGVVEVDKEQKSPVSYWDDYLWTQVYSVAVCRCGVTKRTAVGTKNGRPRSRDLRAGHYG
jgi:hypothetical protein